MRAEAVVLKRRFTKFGEIMQSKGHCAVQGHSRSLILVPIDSWYTTSYEWSIQTYLLSCTVSKLWLSVGQIFANERWMPPFNALAGVIPCQYRHWIIAKNDILWPAFSLQKVLYWCIFFGLHFRCRKYWCIFNNFYVIRSPRVGLGHHSFPNCLFSSSSFSIFYFSLSFIGFTYFLLLSIASLSIRTVPLRFQAGGL